MRILFFSFILLLLNALAPFFALAQEDWYIDAFHSDIRIQDDGTVTVTETITADFRTLRKHGIFRDLPTAYHNQDGTTTYTTVAIRDIFRDQGPERYDVTRNTANLRIRIGDPDVTISGQHIYTITYTVAGVLQSFSSYDELYWNVTGHDWDAPIARASATVTLPDGEIIQSTCHTGSVGATDPCTITSTDPLTFSTQNLGMREGLTVAIGFESGLVPIIVVDAPPSVIDVIQSPIYLTLTALLTALGIGSVLYRWWYYGRDRWWLRKHLHDPHAKETNKPLRARDVISVEYEPPHNLRPAEVGVLMDEKADTLDVSATIVDLAVRGYLTISEVEKAWIFGKADYTLHRTKKEDALLPYESLLLEKLFSDGDSVSLSELKNSFYKDLQSVKEALYKEVTTKQLFADNPRTVRIRYAALGAIGTAIGVALVITSIAWIENSEVLRFWHGLLVSFGVAIGISGVFGLLLSGAMPRKTARGRELYRRVRGYELFVSGTEKYRQPFFERENIFMEVLPYAMVFGVTDKLANAFDEMGLTPPQPTWYTGTHPFAIAAFSSSMDSFSKSLSSAMASTPSSSGSSGGGSSGGGFGGGGGGSW